MPRPFALFISYSHKDDEWRAKLDSHLALLKRQRVFDVWQDRRIGAGQEWAGAIDDALERAAVVLLLVSADFLASDYCYDKEMKRALQRHEERTARVVPVILRTCDWKTSDFGKLEAVPRDGQPIASHRDVDEALTEVALALRTVAEEMRGGSAAPPTPQQPWPARTLKIRPFKPEWPANFRGMRLAAGLVFTVAALASIAYALMLRPPLDEARNRMRIAEYARAAKALDALPPWATAWPGVKGLKARAAFGSRLAGGELINSLSPELDALGKLYPQDPDVLVFKGLKAYYVDRALMPAIQQFTLAAERDEAHVEAHFLGAGRNVELAYLVLAQGDEPRARAAATEARKLVDRAVKRSGFARDLPRYANQLAELDELEGGSQAAYDAYARLAHEHALSAVQSAMLSWRLPQAAPAVRNGLESVESAIQRIGQEPPDLVAVEGWTFRISATEMLPVRPNNEKLCLLEWVQAISKSLLPSAPPSSAAAAPASCGSGALARRIVDVVCVEAITAQKMLPAGDGRKEVLEDWRARRLRCDEGVEPIQFLAPAASTVKPTALHRVPGAEHEHGHA